MERAVENRPRKKPRYTKTCIGKKKKKNMFLECASPARRREKINRRTHQQPKRKEEEA